MPDRDDNLGRYHRQVLLPGFGAEGQRRLLAAHAMIVGCGALGGMIADLLARAGVGTLSIIDRDLVDLTNLHRQVLYEEADAEAGFPKAEAARARLARINGDVTIHAHVDDFSHRNAERYLLAAKPDVILDGLDNFQARYILNDLAVKHGLPYIYGGAVGTTGMSMAVLPETSQWTADHVTPCLRCIFPDAPPPGSSPTCDTAGILGPVAAMIASHQATQALKLLSGNVDALDRSLLSIEAWGNQTRRIDLSAARDAEACPCCGHRQFDHLEGRAGGDAVHLCGSNAVQITAGQNDEADCIDLEALAARLAPHGRFSTNRFLLRGVLVDETNDAGEPYELTVFRNGRTIIRGTDRLDVARSIHARYIGS